MEEAQRLKGWQMGVLAALFALLISTMFMPAIHISGTVCKRIVEDYTKEIKDSVKDGKSKVIGNLFGGSWLSGLMDATTDELLDEWLDELIGYTVDDDDVEEIDENIAEREEEDGVKLRNISPLRMMTHSLAKLIISKDAQDDDLEDIFEGHYEEYNKGYNLLRICLWVAYIASGILLLLVIAGFALGWSKKVPLITSLAYSVVAGIFFAYLRFGFIGHFWKKFAKLSLDNSLTEIMPIKPLHHLYSVALPFALIVCVGILAISIVSLVLREKEEVLDYDREYGYSGDFYVNSGEGNSALCGTQAFINNLDTYGSGGAQSDIQPFNEEVSGYYVEPDIIPEKQMPIAQVIPSVPVIQPMSCGKVRCTKGVALGQGFQLPQDRKVIVGKSPSKTNLTINHPNVSNVHCSIRYNPAMNTYIVKDHSTNGTFVNGARMPKGVPIEYPAGTVLVLADGTNEITLG